jgi:hypothetical protein
MMIQTSKSRVTSVLPSVLIILFTIAYLLTAYLTLDAASRRVPVLAAIVTLALLLLDVLKETLPRAGAVASADAPNEHDGDTPVSRGREIKAILFVVGGVVGIYLIGFLAAIPLYLVASIAYLGAQPLRTAVIVAILSSLSIYLIFELALQYRLFPGILFY